MVSCNGPAIILQPHPALDFGIISFSASWKCPYDSLAPNCGSSIHRSTSYFVMPWSIYVTLKGFSSYLPGTFGEFYSAMYITCSFYFVFVVVYPSDVLK
jgi:hypothetical protein